MEQTILLEQRVEATSETARIGGRALLPSGVSWPQNPDNTPLTLICSLPAKFLNESLNIHINESLHISVFSTYSKTDYFLDSIVYNGNSDELENIKSGYTKVLIHERGNPRNDSPYLIPSTKVETEKLHHNDNFLYTGSKIGGEPGLLQNDNLQLSGYNFALQLYSSDFPAEYEDIFYLTDSVGYLFIAENCQEGLFFTQST